MITQRSAAYLICIAACMVTLKSGAALSNTGANECDSTRGISPALEPIGLVASRECKMVLQDDGGTATAYLSSVSFRRSKEVFPVSIVIPLDDEMAAIPGADQRVAYVSDMFAGASSRQIGKALLIAHEAFPKKYPGMGARYEAAMVSIYSDCIAVTFQRVDRTCNENSNTYISIPRKRGAKCSDACVSGESIE